jgi:hypothetical protein
MGDSEAGVGCGRGGGVPHFLHRPAMARSKQMQIMYSTSGE